MTTPSKDVNPDIPGIELALRRAYELGKDCEWTSYQLQADRSQAELEQLISDTKAALEAFAAGPTRMAK